MMISGWYVPAFLKEMISNKFQAKTPRLIIIIYQTIPLDMGAVSSGPVFRRVTHSKSPPDT